MVESLAPEATELNGSDEVIVINFDSSESDYKEIPLAFLANSPNGESNSDDDDDDTKSNEDASVSGELLNPAEAPKESPTNVEKSISYEIEGTCVETTPQASDSDENGTCPPTESPEEENDTSESDETPKIVMKKTIIISDDDSSESSSEPVDMIINPFLPESDIAEILKPKVEEEDEKLNSDELAFNLIDSNDIKKYSDDINRNMREEEQSFIHKRFTGFINALMNAFVFA